MNSLLLHSNSPFTRALPLTLLLAGLVLAGVSIIPVSAQPSPGLEPAASAVAGSSDGPAWHAMGDGPGFNVGALIEYEGELIAGGRTWSSGVARWDGQTWYDMSQGLTAQPVQNFAIHEGDLLATIYEEVLRWDGSEWQSFEQPVPGEGSVRAIVVHEGDLVATRGTTVARWDGSMWHTLGSGMSGAMAVIYTLLSHADGLVAGGRFSAAGDTPANNVALWDGEEWLPMSTGLSVRVRELASFEGDVIAGSGGVARWDGSAWHQVGTFPSQFYTVEIALGVHLGDLYAAHAHDDGHMKNMGSAVFRWDGKAWKLVGTINDFGMPGSLASYRGDLIAGGGFGQMFGMPASNIARFHEPSEAPADGWEPMGAGLDGPVSALAVHDGSLVAAGVFEWDGDQSMLATWDGSAWTPLDGGPNGTVSALIVHEGDLIAAGNFTTAGGQAAARIARWDGSAWHPLGEGLDNTVEALTVYEGHLIAGGHFDGRVVRWDGSEWVTFGGGLQGSVWSLAVHGGDLIAGGDQDDNLVNRWDGSVWHPLGPLIVFPARVTSLGEYDGMLIASVEVFYYYGSISGVIASWDGWGPFGWVSHPARAFANLDGQLIAGGEFAGADGKLVRQIASWKGSEWGHFGTGFDGSMNALLYHDGALIAGGDFTTAGSVAASNIARWPVGVVGTDPDAGPPEAFELAAPYPNPFTRSSTIEFSVPEASSVEVVVYDMLGRLVVRLADGELAAGSHSVTLDGAQLAAGTYFLVLRTGDQQQTRKVTVLR